jgi:glycosyltransferase involved in cell wall biosynthesis
VASVRQIGTAMLRRGHNVNVASLSDTQMRKWIGDFPIRNICLGPSVLTYSFSPKFILWFFRNASSYDVLVINGLWQFHGIATAVMAWLLDKPYVVYIHGMLGPLGKGTLWKYSKKLAYWTLLEYWVVSKARFAIFASEEEAVLAKNFFPFFRWREAVVRNGIERPPALRQEDKMRLLSRFPELRGKSIVLFLGRLNPGKGCDILLEAFAAELSRDSRYHLMVVGPIENPEYTSFLHAKAMELDIAEQVTWTGLLIGGDKEAAFTLASLFVSPSHHENFGFAVVEAIARGVPVIATNKINIHELLSSAEAAIVCDDTVQGVSQALRKWISMTDQARESLQAKQLEAFERLFSVEQTAEQLDSVLIEAISGRPSIGGYRV